MSRGSKRGDLLRLRSIIKLIIEPFSDHDMDFMNTEQKLIAAMRPDEYPIYRRKILRKMPVYGMWWMDESQWANFLWQGHKATVIRTNQDPDRVLASKAFEKGSCYIRENGDRIDLEAMSKTSKWCPKKRKKIGDAYEWLTVSITREEYENLNDYLGPRDEGCRHD